MKKFNKAMLKQINQNLNSQNKRVNEAVEQVQVSNRNVIELEKYGVEI